MITLRTGLPRSGKTHSCVAWLLELQKYWVTEAGSRDFRTVYTNVKGLKLPHLPLPIADEVYNAEGNLVSYSVVWSQIVQGALVIIDECQDTFPPRTVGQKALPHVAYLNTHGHQGLDIVCITQHPKLIDNAVRRLTNKHLHYRKNTLKIKGMWFVPDAVTYEWDHSEDGLQGLKNAVMGSYSYTKEVNDLYVSAAEHRTPSFKRPWWIWVPVVLLPLGVWASIEGGSKVKAMFVDKTAFVHKAKTPLEKPAQPASRPSGWSEPPTPAASAVQAPAPVLAVPAPVVSFSGCARAANLCRCYTTTAQLVEKSLDFCQAETTFPVVKAPPVQFSHVEDLFHREETRPDLDLIAWASKRR